MRYQVHMIFFACLLFSSNELLAQYSSKDFAPLHKLAGNWKMTTNKGWLYEHWFIINDTTLQNKSYRVHGADTIPQETVLLQKVGGSITYNSTVANQNNGKAVSFVLVNTTNGRYVFENKSHDFPQHISYQLAGNDSLSATISGKMNDIFKELRFNYVRFL